MRIAVLKLLVAAVAVVLSGVALREYRVASRGPRAPQRDALVLHSPETEAIERRSRVKTQLARRVIAERIPLTEAAALFDAVNGEDGTNVVRSLPGRSLREKLCRQVVFYVASAESDLVDEGHSLPEPRVSAELQAELDRRLAAGEFPPEPEVR